MTRGLATVTAIDDYRAIWHAAHVRCPCGWWGYTCVPSSRLDGPLECLTCGAMTLAVVDHDETPRLLRDAQAVRDLAARGAAVVEPDLDPDPPEAA